MSIKLTNQLKQTMIITLSVVTILGIGGYAFLQHPKFGRFPSGKRLEQIEKSPNYRNGRFQNLPPTPVMSEEASYFMMFKDYIAAKNKPDVVIPSMKTDLLHLDRKQDIMVWFGHSSYFIQVDGKRILVDPVLSGYASPLAFTTRAFKGTDRYTADDIPEIDYLFISHDHWDHLDYETVMKLKPKIKTVVCALGVGEDFEYWGFDPKAILEKDWNQEIVLGDGFVVHTVPARHFSGRGLQRNKTQWSAFVLQTPNFKFFMGGDGGYDTHFAEVGKAYGPFDLAILENGQNNQNWKYIHMKSEEVFQAAKDLQAKRLFPVHNSKFALALHTWDWPLKHITALNAEAGLSLVTPMIGEAVDLDDASQKFSEWWVGIK
jgi:L-ascorbate metabolism protein UlaG (beta-lactamase superfamily)